MKLRVYADVSFRALLVLFVDSVLARRTSWIFEYKNSFLSWLEYKDTIYTNGMSDLLTAVAIAFSASSSYTNWFICIH